MIAIYPPTILSTRQTRVGKHVRRYQRCGLSGLRVFFYNNTSSMSRSAPPPPPGSAPPPEEQIQDRIDSWSWCTCKKQILQVRSDRSRKKSYRKSAKTAALTTSHRTYCVGGGGETGSAHESWCSSTKSSRNPPRPQR